MKETRVRTFAAFRVAFACGLLLSSVGCGLLKQISNIQQPAPMNVAGNWQFDLMDSNGSVAAISTGFLQQSGSTITGALDINGCATSASVTGTTGGTNGPTGINLSMDVGGKALQVSGSGVGAITPGTALNGTYTVGAIGCSISGLTATVSAQQINPVSGAFHGTVQSKNGGTFNIAGNLTQGQNTGVVTAPLSGTGTVTNSTCFSSVNLSGTISGTSTALNFASSDGSQTAQLAAGPQAAAGQIGGTPGSFTITQLSGTYAADKGSCSGDTGTFSVTFP